MILPFRRGCCSIHGQLIGLFLPQSAWPLIRELSVQNEEAPNAFGFCHQKTCYWCETTAIEGFKSDKDGRIVWTGVAEETDLPDAEVERLQEEAIAVAEAPWGRGHRARVRNVLYDGEWEMHWILHKYKSANSLFYLVYVVLMFGLYNTSKRIFFINSWSNVTRHWTYGRNGTVIHISGPRAFAVGVKGD